MTLGPIGYFPLAPGTYGSAVACLFLYCCPSFFAHPLFILILIALALAILNRLAFTEKDPGYVVIDELVGMFVAMAGHRMTFVNLLAGFALFRFFDIVKPYPIRKVEGFRKGYGILADDILAGIFTSLVLLLARRVLS